MLKFLADRTSTDAGLVAYARQDKTVTFVEFTAAASMAFRGTGRPDYATRIERVRRFLKEDGDMDELSAVLKARELVNKVSPTRLPVSVKAYTDQVGAIIHVDEDLKPDEQGYCVDINGKLRICVNENDDETRRRFTVCHEIAHRILGLPSEHSGISAWNYAKRSPNEILCDVFAANCYFPTNYLSRLSKNPISVLPRLTVSQNLPSHQTWQQVRASRR
jgi:hypothetical protein